jgi:hypothetical protein
MGKESVSIPSVIPNRGIDALVYIVGRETGIYLTNELMGGPDRVNRQGKVAKRIKRNLKRELGVDISNGTMTAIGNAVNKHTLKDENFLAEYAEDLLEIVGKFNDTNSCFQEGWSNHHNLLAMDDAPVLAFCIYRSNGRNLGRSWCFMAKDGAEVHFNAYGLELDKIGKIASALKNKPYREGYIRSTQDIWLNNGGRAVILGGERDTTNYLMDLNDPEDYAPDHCGNCNRGIWTGELHTFEETGETWCCTCYHRRFWECDRCGGERDRESDPPQLIQGGRQYRRVCLDCARENYRQCTQCQTSGENRDVWLVSSRAKEYTTRTGEELILCRDHWRYHTRCYACRMTMTPHVALDVYVDRHNTRRVCPDCVNQLSDFSFCPECEVLSIYRFGSQCRKCGGEGSNVTLIVQDPDSGEVEIDRPEQERPVTDSGSMTTNNGAIWVNVSFDDQGQIIAEQAVRPIPDQERDTTNPAHTEDPLYAPEIEPGGRITITDDNGEVWVSENGGESFRSTVIEPGLISDYVEDCNCPFCQAVSEVFTEVEF